MTGVASARVTSSAGVVSAGVVGAGVVGADGVGVVGAGVVSAGVVEADVKLMEAATVGLAGVVGMAEWFGLAGLAELVEWDGIAKLVGSKGPAGSVSGVRMVAGSPCETVVAGSVGSMCSVMGSTVAPLLFPPHIERPASPSIDQFDGTGPVSGWAHRTGQRVGTKRARPSTSSTERDATGPVSGSFHRQARRVGTQPGLSAGAFIDRPDGTGRSGRFCRPARRVGTQPDPSAGASIDRPDETGCQQAGFRAEPSASPTERDTTGPVRGRLHRPARQNGTQPADTSIARYEAISGDTSDLDQPMNMLAGM